jgi:NADPH:quinone reductase-like Zn-dependent oxidoreductase
VLVISTDYRDLRKSGFQQFVLGIQFNIVRLPPRISSEAAAGLGVAFVAAALSLGVCAGLDFGDVLGGPNLLGILREKGGPGLPEDVREECLEGISQSDRIRRGDWLALWGGSSTSAFIACQLARLAGVRVMSVLDLQKHGAVQTDFDTATRPDLLVDNSDTERAISVVRSAAKERLRFGIDFIGSKTASHLLSSLATNAENAAELSETSTINDKATRADSPDMKNTQSHLIGLTGLPKTGPPSGCVYHKVPIKVFHDVPEVGRSLVLWLERLLEQGLLQPPAVLSVSDGLESVNSALDKMRRGEISGGRAVVRLAAGDR